MDLLELQQRIERKRELERDLPILLEKLIELEAEERRLQIQLAYEEEDVVRLENKTFYSCFYSLLGKRDEMLERELTEAEDAKAAHAAVVELLADLQKTISRMEREAGRLKNCEKEYSDAINASILREGERFRQVDSNQAREWLQLETEYTRLGQRIEQLKKALEEGRIACQRADFITEVLQEAWEYEKRNHDFAKYERWDEAQSRVEAFQIQLKRFIELFPELNLDVSADIQVTRHGIERFLDIFLFDDLENLLKTKTSVLFVYQVDNVAKYVRAAVANIKERIEQCEKRQNTVYEHLQEILNK